MFGVPITRERGTFLFGLGFLCLRLSHGCVGIESALGSLGAGILKTWSGLWTGVLA